MKYCNNITQISVTLGIYEASILTYSFAALSCSPFLVFEAVLAPVEEAVAVAEGASPFWRTSP